MPLAVCGEMGGRPLEAMALIGLGIDRLSITPAAVGPIKAMVRSLDRARVAAEHETLLADPPRDMRGALPAWAADAGRRTGLTGRPNPRGSIDRHTRPLGDEPAQGAGRPPEAEI